MRFTERLQTTWEETCLDPTENRDDHSVVKATLSSPIRVEAAASKKLGRAIDTMTSNDDSVNSPEVRAAAGTGNRSRVEIPGNVPATQKVRITVRAMDRDHASGAVVLKASEISVSNAGLPRAIPNPTADKRVGVGDRESATGTRSPVMDAAARDIALARRTMSQKARTPGTNPVSTPAGGRSSARSSALVVTRAQGGRARCTSTRVPARAAGAHLDNRSSAA